MRETQLPLANLLRRSVCSRMAGYEDVNDAEWLSQDPTFRLIGSEKIWDRGAALTSRLQTFGTEMRRGGELRQLGAYRELIGKAEALDSPQRVVLDIGLDRDSGVRPAGAERLQRPAGRRWLPEGENANRRIKGWRLGV